MKHITANSPQSSNFVTARPTSSAFAVSEAMKQSGSPIRFGKVWFQGYEVADRPVVNVKDVDVQHIPSLKGNKETVTLLEEKVKRVKFTIIDAATGLPKEVMGRLRMRKVAVLCCGTTFHFSCKAGSQSVLDSRDGKRKPLNYVKSELVRLLGVTKGEEQFAELVA